MWWFSSTCVSCDTNKSDQFSLALTKPHELPHVSCENLDAMVIVLCYIHYPSVVTRYAEGGLELGLPTTSCFKMLEVRSEFRT